MATLKYSRQRASIKEYLDHTTEHPTADTVYLHVREEFPRISLGTVYRNLNLLADMGEAIKITTLEVGKGGIFRWHSLPSCHQGFYDSRRRSRQQGRSQGQDAGHRWS